MTKPTELSPARWADVEESTSDARLGELFRAVSEPAPLSAATLARVHARLGSRRHSSLLPRRLREAALATVMLLAGSSLAVAGWGVKEWLSASLHRAEPAPGGAAPRSAGSLHPRKHAALPAPRPAAPATSADDTALAPDLALPEPEPNLHGAPHALAKGTEPNVSAAPADSSALASESLALQAALVKLRREHDARGALALLDQSEPLFARGALALEAQVTRVDALLALGRSSEALAILNHLPLAHIGRGGELRLLRAELRAKQDCGLALADFDVLVRQPLSSSLAERALYGRAACEIRVGDDSHARRDFQDYLARFPGGRFADHARNQLAALASSDR
ncbi:MAG TPA: hypothetical protein VGL19_22405 [Polyangiaceae bacterium]|jgi:hypothetical protein